MRIGVDARPLAEAQPSGISSYAFYCIRAMAQRSTNDEFILFTSGTTRPNNKWLSELEEFPNVTRHHLSWPNKLFHSLGLLGLTPSIDKQLGNIDVLFAPNLHIMPLSASVPLVLTVHDVSFKLYSQCLSWRRRLWHRAVKPAALMQRAASIIAVSTSTGKDCIREYQLPKEKVHTVLSAVPEASAAESVEQLPKQYALAISTIEPRKNIQALVTAFQYYREQHPDSTLELVIAGSAGWKSSDTIKQIQNTSYIHYYGYVTPGQKTTLLQSARLFVYPSLYEGFGFPPLEAMQAHTPVLASRVGALPEVLGNAAYYVDPYSIVDLSAGIHALATDETLRNTLTTLSAQVLQRLSWKACADATLNILHESV